MIDKNQDQNENQDQNHDEYQFVDIDSMEPELGDIEHDSLSTGSTVTDPWYSKKENLRYALIAVVAIIATMVIYKFMGSVLSSKSTQPPASTPISVIKPPPVQPVTPMLQPQPIVAVQNPPIAFSQKISALEVSQGSISSDVNNLNNQMTTLTSHVNDLNSKIDQLTQAMNSLAAQAAVESQQLAVLSARTKPIIKRVIKTAPVVSAPVYYYIQAVIPGRAWLVSANGVTMTVREGTSVPGYGIVKLIDPAQGRIVMSSGRIIAFSQQDT